MLGEAKKLAKLLCDLPQTCLGNDRMSVLTNIYKLVMMTYISNEFEFGWLVQDQ